MCVHALAACVTHVGLLLHEHFFVEVGWTVVSVISDRNSQLATPDILECFLVHVVALSIAHVNARSIKLTMARACS